MRQSLSRVVSGDIILCGRIECLELQRAQFRCRRRERLEVEEHDLLTVSRYKLPSRLVALARKRREQAVETAELHRRADLLVERDVAADLCLLRLAHARDVHLVAVAAHHRGEGARLHRRYAANLMVRRHGDMGTHRDGREDHARATLDGESADGICVIARPGLRHVVQDACIEAAAAARAALEQDVRMRLRDALENVVEAEHEARAHLTLAFWRQFSREGIRQMAVEVPLDVVNRRGVENLADSVDEVVAHIGAREVEHELMAAEAHRIRRRPEHPVRMRAVEVRVDRHHLRFKPETELEAALVRALRDALQAAL